MEYINNISPSMLILAGLILLILVVTIGAIFQGSKEALADPYDNLMDKEYLDAKEKDIYREKLDSTTLRVKVYDIINSWNGEWKGHDQIVEDLSNKHNVIMGVNQSREICKRLRDDGYLKVQQIRGEEGRMIGSGYFVV